MRQRGEEQKLLPSPLQRDLELLHQPTAGTGRLRTRLSRGLSPACSCGGIKKANRMAGDMHTGQRSAGLAGTTGVGRAGTCCRRQQPDLTPFLTGGRICRALEGPQPSDGGAPQGMACRPAQKLLLLPRNPNQLELLLSIKPTMTQRSWLAKGLANVSRFHRCLTIFRDWNKTQGAVYPAPCQVVLATASAAFWASVLGAPAS